MLDKEKRSSDEVMYELLGRKCRREREWMGERVEEKKMRGDTSEKGERQDWSKAKAG